MVEKNTKQEIETSENLRIYEQARNVPKTALKEIKGGRLKGMSDINPMFRIKRITELFGPCGFGWKYEIVKQWLETYGNQVKGFTQINLYVKMDGEWSEPIPGVGGADFVSNEKSGVFVNDEVHKMGLTDALSVAMKALGIAADVYWDKDGKSLNPGDSKYAYSTQTQPAAQPAKPAVQQLSLDDELNAEQAALNCESTGELTALWSKYKSMNPAYVRNGSPFFKAVQQRGAELKQKEQNGSLF